MTELSRRAFLGAASAAVVAAALPFSADEPKTLVTAAPGRVMAGDVFTIAGVYAVDPVTKVAKRNLQQFRVIGSTSRNQFMLGKAR